jgi:oligoribonuclease NrnB/cAMP/cGMP phosphodiesterase (DHH superfamily)
MIPKLVVYHAQCRDGFASAWAAWTLGYHAAEFHAAAHGSEPPDVTGKNVLILDFSYDRATLDHMYESAAFLRVFDHHKTAETTLLDAPYAAFDLNRSGAGITWDVLSAELPHELIGRVDRPWLINYVEDRDLWRFALPNSKEINAYISTLEFDFETWATADIAFAVHTAADRGKSVLAKTEQYVREVAKNARLVSFEGHSVHLVNAPQVDISEVLAYLLEESSSPFSMGWWQRADGSFNYSLRSRADVTPSFDVSELAKRHGGGGHPNASGFQTEKALFL